MGLWFFSKREKKVGKGKGEGTKKCGRGGGVLGSYGNWTEVGWTERGVTKKGTTNVGGGKKKGNGDWVGKRPALFCSTGLGNQGEQLMGPQRGENRTAEEGGPEKEAKVEFV